MIDKKVAVIGVDPGVKRSAYALSVKHKIVRCGWTTDRAYQADLRLTDLAVIEMPDRVRIGPQQDILDLAAAVGYIEACVPENVTTRRVSPSEWKGTQTKPHSHRRIWQELSMQERRDCASCIGKSESFIYMKIQSACERYALTRKVTKYRWNAHNLLDAIGITLNATGRLR